MVWLDGFRVADLVAVPGGGRPLYLGGLGLAAGAAAGAWYELARMRRALAREWPAARLPLGALGTMSGIAAVAALPALGAWWFLRVWSAAAALAVVLAVYGSVYLALSRSLGLSELAVWLGRLRGRRRG
jgi:hypothetical protein